MRTVPAKFDCLGEVTIYTPEDGEAFFTRAAAVRPPCPRDAELMRMQYGTLPGEGGCYV